MNIRTHMPCYVATVVALCAIVTSVVIGFQVYESTGGARHTEVESYIDLPDGGVMFGDYCQKDGTVLDGGVVCHATTYERLYTNGERIATTFAWVVITLMLGCCLTLIAYMLAEGRDRVSSTV